MEKNINIAEILERCPKGMELDCTMFDDVKFIRVEEDDKPICIRTGDIYRYLTQFGTWTFDDNAKCVIFPKGKTTWEGFLPPCQFKEGDVLVSEHGNIVLLSHIDSENFVHYHCIITTYGSFRIEEDTKVGVERYYDCVLANEQQKQRMYDKIKSSGYKYNQNTNKLEKLVEPKFNDGDIVVTTLDNIALISNKNNDDDYKCHCLYIGNNLIVEKLIICPSRLATEEEKQELFDAINANGYKWNADTKTLEKLPEPIEEKGNISDGYHTFNELYEYRLLYNASMFNELAKQGLYDVHKSKKHSDGAVPFGDENWFIVQAELPTGQISNHYEMKDWELFNIPEKEKANYYDGHSPKDVAKRLRDFLSLKKFIAPKFKVGDKVQDKDGYKVRITEVSIEYECYGYKSLAINRIGGIPFNRQDDWELVPNKFDITTLKPFDKVLVRDNDDQMWTVDMFSFFNRKNIYPFACVGHYVSQCIPYEGNEHLLGTTNDCDDFYKTWE